MATSVDPAAARAYWTPQRMAGAEPLDGREGAPSILPASASAPFTSTVVSDPAAYPNRVHGKLFGTFALVEDYSCSATLVSSGSGSLITTAGHCVFDQGTTNQFATKLTFVPGYRNGSEPFGQWPATNLATTGGWVQEGNLDFDTGMVRLDTAADGTTAEETIGSRGIAFNQKRRQKLVSYGYPAAPTPEYDGEQLIRCSSRYTPDPVRHSSTPSIGMGCDMHEGSSGGGWVIQDTFVISNVSHGHTAGKVFYGPYYGTAIKSLYRAKLSSYPSIGPITCRGRVADMIGTDAVEMIAGSGRNDVIASLGGADTIRSKGGKDIICSGAGNDSVDAGGGNDRIDGGTDSDECDGGGGSDVASACESNSRIP